MGKSTYSISRLFFLLIVSVITHQSLVAQCGSSTQTGATCTRSSTFYGEILPNGGCASPTTVVNYSPGTHFRIPVLLGGCYSVSTCGAPINTQIAAFQGAATTGPFAYNDDNGPSCTGTAASIVMVPNFTDYARVDIREAVCSAGGTSSITIRVQQNNNLAFTSSSAPLCQGQTRVLTATPAPVGGIPQPNSGNTGTFSGGGVAGNIFTAPLPSAGMQTYPVTYTFGYCSTTLGIDVYRNPSIANAGANFSVCTSSFNMNGNVPTYGTGTWAIISGSGTLTNPNTYNATVSGITPGTTTTLTYTISNGPCVATRDTVTVYQEFLPTVAVASQNQALCSTNASVTANTPLVGTGLWYLLAGSGNITTPAGPNTTITALGAGTNIFIWSITNGVCPASNDSVTITRDVPPTPAFAGPDIAMCDSSINLNGNAPVVGTGLWSILTGSGNLAAPTNPNTSISNVPLGTTQLLWSITNGVCPASVDTVDILRNNRPNAPSITGNLNVCEGSQTLLTASSTATIPNFRWWDAPVGGTLLASTAAYSTPPITGTVTYYVEVADASTLCESDRIAVTVNMVPNPTVNIGADRIICDNDTACFVAPSGLSAYIWSNGSTAPATCTAAAGMVWVQVSDANSCIGRDTAMVTLTPSPSVSLGADTTFCPGGSISLGNFSGNNTYLWSTGATSASINVNSSGTYAVTCTAPGGCAGADTIVVTLGSAVQAAFTVDTSFCPQIVFVDNSTGANSWSWNFGDGATSTLQNPVHGYTASSSYNVSMTASGVCGTNTASQTVPVNCLVGVNLPSRLVMTVYPNPNFGQFKIKFEGVESDVDMLIFNELGQKVFASSLEDQRGDFETAIDLGKPAKGVYFLTLKMGDASVTKRIIVQ